MDWDGSVPGAHPEGRELVFDLAEGQSLPEEFKESEEIDIINRPDWQAVHLAELGRNAGYYEIIHVKSGKSLKTADDDHSD